MATFPSYVKLGWRDTAEKPTPVVLRSEMEKGVARQRRVAADSVVTVPVTAYFDTAADSLAFESWFFGDVGAGAAWFDFTLPRSGTVTQARVVGGDIGQLKPATKNWAFSERTFQIEYIRPGFIQLAPGLHTVNPARILSVQRNSTATYVDDDGLLQTAAANVARYQGGQVLVEGEATNRIPNSQNFGAWSAFGINNMTVLTGVADPFGGTSAARLTATASSALFQQAVTVTAGVTLTGSFWIRRHTGSGDVSYRVGDGTTHPVTVTGTWQRVSITAVASTTSGRIGIVMAVSGDAVEIFGAQLELGAAMTSYIPTTTAAVARAADLITVAA